MSTLRAPARRSIRSSSRAPALLLALLGGACTASIGEAPGGSETAAPPGAGPGPGAGPMVPGQGPGPATPPGGAGPAAGACQDVAPGPSPLRRLTRDEYDNTVRDLLGETSRPARDFPEEERAHGFDNSAHARSVSDLLADRYFVAAAKLAEVAVAKLPTLLPCDPDKDGEARCLDQFLDGFGKRAWRRPLTADERANLKQAFAEGKTSTFAEGINAVVQVLLASPQFLYRVETGTPVPGSKALALTGHELASRLSYLLWGTMPDAELMAAADAGTLTTRAAVKAQAERMLKDPRAQAMVARFSDQWLRLDEIASTDKDAMFFPSFTEALRGPLREETQKLVEHVVWNGDGKLGGLLTARTTFVNGPLAAFYGMTGVSGDAFREVPLDTSKRAGFLGHAGILAVTGVPDDSLTALIFRGIFVRERLFCQPLADPPANAQAENPPFTPTTTAREWAEARQAKANCGACHRAVDPIGFGLENFDGIGQWRSTDRGKPVDARGELHGTDVDGPFSGAVELSDKLGKSRMVTDCVATQWFRFGYGREEDSADACTTQSLRTAFASAGGDLRALLVALTQTDAFMFKSPPEAQTAQTGAKP